MSNTNLKKFICPVSSNPNLAAEEIKKKLKKVEVDNSGLDLSGMNLFDAVKVLVLTSSYLYKKFPAQTLKFKFVSAEIKSVLASFSLTNLEMV